MKEIYSLPISTSIILIFGSAFLVFLIIKQLRQKPLNVKNVVLKMVSLLLFILITLSINDIIAENDTIPNEPEQLVGFKKVVFNDGFEMQVPETLRMDKSNSDSLIFYNDNNKVTAITIAVSPNDGEFTQKDLENAFLLKLDDYNEKIEETFKKSLQTSPEWDKSIFLYSSSKGYSGYNFNYIMTDFGVLKNVKGNSTYNCNYLLIPSNQNVYKVTLVYSEKDKKDYDSLINSIILYED